MGICTRGPGTSDCVMLRQLDHFGHCQLMGFFIFMIFIRRHLHALCSIRFEVKASPLHQIEKPAAGTDDIAIA